MGDIHPPAPVLLILAVSSRHDAALDWARERCAEQYGPVVLSSEPFDFTETDYYTATMGAGLKKQFLAFERLIDSAALAGIKRADQRLGSRICRARAACGAAAAES